jgi:hypothetical protein
MQPREAFISRIRQIISGKKEFIACSIQESQNCKQKSLILVRFNRIFSSKKTSWNTTTVSGAILYGARKFKICYVTSRFERPKQPLIQEAIIKKLPV